jgi:3-deoxy-7-phosphoheptulonate synthase
MKTILALLFACDAPSTSLRSCLAALGFTGPHPGWRRHAPGLVTVSLVAPPAPETLERLRRVPGLERIVDRTAALAPPLRRGSVRIGPRATLGPDRLAIIAGPCSVEGEAQVCEIAEMAAEAGADALRGGAFKPRSSPYSFGGLGEEALEHLALARERTGLPVVTEVLDAADLDLVASHADVLQIGSRNMHNFPLLFRAGSHPRGRPILLKRGMAATVEELRLAAEYVRLGQLLAGFEDDRLILCERGVRTFETAVRYALDIAAIPILQATTAFPVVADPSHAAGTRQLVRPLASACVAAGADGLLVEVHTDPKASWCDADQTIGPAELEALVREARSMFGLRSAALGPVTERIAERAALRSRP